MLLCGHKNASQHLNFILCVTGRINLFFFFFFSHYVFWLVIDAVSNWPCWPFNTFDSHDLPQNQLSWTNHERQTHPNTFGSTLWNFVTNFTLCLVFWSLFEFKCGSDKVTLPCSSHVHPLRSSICSWISPAFHKRLDTITSIRKGAVWTLNSWLFGLQTFLNIISTDDGTHHLTLTTLASNKNSETDVKCP